MARETGEAAACPTIAGLNYCCTLAAVFLIFENSERRRPRKGEEKLNRRPGGEARAEGMETRWRY